VVPFDAGGIFAVDEPRQLVRAQATGGFPSGFGMPATHGIVGTVVQTGRARLVPVVTADPQYVVVRPTTASQLTVPLTSPCGVMGAISLEADVPGAFTEVLRPG
jgi:putative methionine-R-sulfoxide reductase with GAF domain